MAGPSLQEHMWYKKHIDKSTLPIGHLINVEMICVLSDTSSFLGDQTSRVVTCGTFFRKII
jgi:hypothetical protein